MSLQVSEAILSEHQIANVQRLDPIPIIRQLPTQETEGALSGVDRPYVDADIRIAKIDIQGDIPVYFSAKYVLSSSLDSIAGIDGHLRQEGHTSLAQNDSLVIVTDSNDVELYRISPIILEKWYGGDGNPYYLVADGNNRLCYLRQQGIETFNAVVVDGISEKHSPPYYPVPFDEVQVLDSPPPVSQRRNFHTPSAEASYQDHRPSFSIFGSTGPRSSPDEIITSTSRRHIIQTEHSQEHAIIEQVRSGFIGYAPAPPDLITMPKVVDGAPEVVDFLGVRPVCVGLGMAHFKIDYGLDLPSDFHFLIKSRESYAQTAVRGTAILSSRESHYFRDSNVRPANEFVISDEMRSMVTTEVLSHDIGISDLPLQSSNNSDAPRVVGVQVDSTNSRFYSVTILKLSDGKEIPIILNRPKIDSRGRQSFGTVTVVRDNLGNTILGYRHREGIGVSQLELPKMFGFDPSRLERDLGIDIARDITPTNTVRVFGGTAMDHSPLHINSFTTSASPSTVHRVRPVTSNFLGFAESSEPGRLTQPEIHSYIGSGKITDLQTVASLTIDQLNHGDIKVEDEYLGHSVLLEEVFDPLQGNILVMPSLSLSFHDRFSPVHPDLGKMLEVSYASRPLTPKDFLQFKRERKLVPVLVSDLTTMAQNGDIDYASLGHLSIMLRRRGVWTLSNQQETLPSPPSPPPVPQN